jgi:nitroreductase
VEFTEVIKRRRMVRSFTGEPLAPGVTERLLRAANRAPSAGFSQGYSFLVLESEEQRAPLWQLMHEAEISDGSTADANPDEIPALSRAPLAGPVLVHRHRVRGAAHPARGRRRRTRRW